MSVLIFIDHLDGHIKKASHEALSYGAKIAEQTGDTPEANPSSIVRVPHVSAASAAHSPASSGNSTSGGLPTRPIGEARHC